jgi:SAM-dependent methyltransferase
MTPLRDLVRSTFVGPILRDRVIVPLRRRRRLSLTRRLAAAGAPTFACPICGYEGAFADMESAADNGRQYAFCPNCGAAERHRLQTRVLDRVLDGDWSRQKSILHFAPEPFFSARLKKASENYKSADLFRHDVDIKADICDLPLDDESVDLVYASHVLEHVPNDLAAIREISRVLKPGSIAILPVPIYSSGLTVEYGQARPEEAGHVRAPGLSDYFDRYRSVFSKVEVFSSETMSVDRDRNQIFIRKMVRAGDQFEVSVESDYVPVCIK